jgi:hypothetical protein
MARKRVIEITAATATLSKNQSGSLVVLNRAAGIVVTLPDAGRGLEYDFVVETAVTNNAVYKIIGNDSPSMHGSIHSASSGGGNLFSANGTTHVAVSFSSATGGDLGMQIKAICDDDGLWHVSGLAHITETETAATPYTTS